MHSRFICKSSPMAVSEKNITSGVAASPPSILITELSDDLTARILLRLRPREIASVALACKRLATVCADDTRVWRPLCITVWSPYTNPDGWLHKAPESPSTAESASTSRPISNPSEQDDSDDDKPPASYREVFVRLRRMQTLVGFWSGVGDAPTGSLFRIAWAPDGAAHLDVTALKPALAAMPPGNPLNAAAAPLNGAADPGVGALAAAGGLDHGLGDAADAADEDAGPNGAATLRGLTRPPQITEETRARVGQAFPGYSLELVDESLAVLKDQPWLRTVRQGSASAGPAGPSAAALAAAAVATGGGGRRELPMGASPPNSFGYEILRFMQGNVAGSRAGGRKGRNRGGGSPGPYGISGGGGAGQPEVLEHLRRLSVPSPTRQRPLAGLWMGIYGPHGTEIVSLSYSGSGPSAAIFATKVTGDPNVPVLETTFFVNAEPLRHPWPREEVELITNRPMFTTNPPAEMAAAVAAAAAAGEAQGSPQPPPAAGILAVPLWALPMWQAIAEGGGVAGGGGEGAAGGATVLERLAGMAAAAAAVGPVDLWEVLGPKTAPPPAASAVRRRLPPPPRVVAVYIGKGRVAGLGFRNPTWVDGRLWVYDNASIGFLWRGDVEFLVDFTRLSSGLLVRPGPTGL